MVEITGIAVERFAKGTLLRLAQQVKQRIYLHIQQVVAQRSSIWGRDPKGNLLQAKLRAVFRKVYA